MILWTVLITCFTLSHFSCLNFWRLSVCIYLIFSSRCVLLGDARFTFLLWISNFLWLRAPAFTSIILVLLFFRDLHLVNGLIQEAILLGRSLLLGTLVLAGSINWNFLGFIITNFAGRASINIISFVFKQSQWSEIWRTCIRRRCWGLLEGLWFVVDWAFIVYFLLEYRSYFVLDDFLFDILFVDLDTAFLTYFHLMQLYVLLKVGLLRFKHIL